MWPSMANSKYIIPNNCVIMNSAVFKRERERVGNWTAMIGIIGTFQNVLLLENALS